MRIRRLTAPPSPVSSGVQAAIMTGLTALVLVPAMIAMMPGLVSLFIEACPFLF